jgi:hypothetical protein
MSRKEHELEKKGPPTPEALGVTEESDAYKALVAREEEVLNVTEPVAGLLNGLALSRHDYRVIMEKVEESTRAALATREEPQCKTPGAVYHTEVGPERVSIAVDLPKWMELDEDEARQLETELHTAVETVLAAAPSTELSLLRANKEVLVRRIIGLEEFARDVAAREAENLKR